MENNSNPPVSKCQPHQFSLKAHHKERRPNLNATLSMCKGKALKNKNKKHKCSQLEAPLLNRDRCYATPAFILPSEKTDYLVSTRQFLRDHEKKVKQYQEELDDLLIPKPRSKNMYCNVCRENYEEYIEHIRTPSHSLNIRHSLFNTYILELEKKFKSTHNQEINAGLNQTGTATFDDDQVEIIGVRGRKLVKTINIDDVRIFHPYAETNHNQAFNASPQNLFFSTPTYAQPFKIMPSFNDCRNFYPPFANFPYNPYLSYAPENPFTMGYSLYGMPYQPIMNISVMQNHY